MISLAYRLRQLERQLATEKAQARRDSFQNFAETLVADGKIARSDQGSIVEFMVSLPEDQADYFQEFLSDRPQAPEYSLSPELRIAYGKAQDAYEAGWRKRREL
jgi:hypothetical protein